MMHQVEIHYIRDLNHLMCSNIKNVLTQNGNYFWGKLVAFVVGKILYLWDSFSSAESYNVTEYQKRNETVYFEYLIALLKGWGTLHQCFERSEQFGKKKKKKSCEIVSVCPPVQQDLMKLFKG